MDNYIVTNVDSIVCKAISFNFFVNSVVLDLCFQSIVGFKDCHSYVISA
jgi:hypothetical protein